VNIYTGGTFDLFHAGHVDLLQQCSDLAGAGGLVTVALNTDEFVEAFKGRRPVIPYGQRQIVLEACRYVDEVIPNIGGADSKPAILAVMPDIVAVGSDWEHRDYYAQMDFDKAWLDEHAIRLVYVPRPTDGPSSTRIKVSKTE
jgi:glycerol-3-phosphate cytidylyltransferase